jgi:hypothetical protein
MKEDHDRKLLEETINGFDSLGLEPQAVPRENISHLRGCLHCIDLKVGNIDSALVLNKLSFVEDPKYFYRVDYAVRGTLSGIPRQREIVYTRPDLEGFLRKRLRGLTWNVPEEQVGELHYSDVHKGSPPLPGEVWEGGPHQYLVELLNCDHSMLEQLTTLTRGLGEPYLRLTVSSDSWGESIRLGGSLWMGWARAIQVYCSPAYIHIADSVLGHIREARVRFGGLTF